MNVIRNLVSVHLVRQNVCIDIDNRYYLYIYMVIYVKSNIVPWSKSFHWRFYQPSKPQVSYVWRSSSQKHPTFNVFTETTLDLSLYHNLPSKKYKKYTIGSIVCETSCHPVTQSFGHSVIRSLDHSVTWSLGHLVTWSLGHLVSWSLSHFVILSFCFNNATQLTD